MGKFDYKIDKIAYFTKGELVTPLTQLRVVGPANFENIEIKANLKFDELNEDALSDANLIVIQRDFPEDLPFFKALTKLAKSLKIPIVYDLDDHLLALPKNHPDRQSHHFTSALIPIYEALLMADYVTVSTQKLKEALISLNENIFVLPNLLDDTLWPFHLPIRQTKAKSITIGYMGGESHKPDIEWITPVLEKINYEFSEEVNFHFYGIKPPEKFLSQSNVSHTELKTYHYKEFIDDFYHFDVDIFIAPLINNLFNQCKSPIKYLEYGTMGAPGVFTDIEPYRNIVADGKNGLLAKSQDEWFDKLMTLIQYPDLRYELAKNAQETVRSNWLMSENAHLWTDTYKNFIQMGPQQTTVRAEKEIIDTISRQLYEYHQHQQTIIAEKDGINKILEDRERLIENQSEQLLHQESNIQSLSDKFHKQEQELQNLRNLVTDRDASIQLLNEKIKEIEGYNITLSTKLSLKGELVQSLDEKLSMMDKELSSLNSQLTEKTKEIENLEAHLKNLREEFESKNALVQQKTQIVSELEEQINNQKIENDSLEAKLSRLEEEVLFYSLSKSWRFTRPIRNLKKLFTGGKHD